MPILYVHGVNVRSRDFFHEIVPFLRRLVAPSISHDPANVLIDDAYWGDLAVDFAFDGISRPRSRLLGQGGGAIHVSAGERSQATAALVEVLKQMPQSSAASSVSGGLLPAGPATADRPPAMRLKDLDDDALSDLLTVAIRSQVQDVAQRAELAMKADEAARDTSVRAELLAASTEKELEVLFDRLGERVQSDAALVGMGVPNWIKGIYDRVSETVSRTNDLPGYVASVVAAEIREPLNELFSVFIGDVLCYLRNRGTATQPGPIPALLMDRLRTAHRNKQQRNEPLVVVTHSMGGQLIYDLVTHYLPGDPALRDLRIDFWCATASQVGFFEEAKLFLASRADHRTGNPVPFPGSHLGIWWNVWDHNDFLSFTTHNIITGVDDEPYDSGTWLLEAHGGYLQRPSFYRRLTKKLHEAAQRSWTHAP